MMGAPGSAHWWARHHATGRRARRWATVRRWMFNAAALLALCAAGFQWPM